MGGSAYNFAAGTAKGVAGIKEDFDKGYWGDEYDDKVLNPKLDREWMKDRDVKEHYRRQYGDRYKEQMEKALEFRKAGITDQGEIDAGLKLIDKNAGLSTEQAINIMQFTKDMSRVDLIKNRDNIKESARRMVDDDEQAERITQLAEQRFKLR